METLSAAQQQSSHVRTRNHLATWIENRRIPSASHHSPFIALQPIFNRHGRVFGYEAFSRSSRTNRFAGDSRHATHHILKGWLGELGRLTAGKPVFLNCTREDLTVELMEPLPVPIVIELLETVEIDEWVVQACLALRAMGHQIALRDFPPSAVNYQLLTVADFIKIDFRICSKDQREELLGDLRQRPLRFIAEKIETREEFLSALNEGFHFFQGYYFARPIVLSTGTARRWLNHLRLRWHSRRRRAASK